MNIQFFLKVKGGRSPPGVGCVAFFRVNSNLLRCNPMHDIPTIEEQLAARDPAVTIVSYLSPEVAKLIVDTGIDTEWLLEDALRSRYADHPAIARSEPTK